MKAYYWLYFDQFHKSALILHKSNAPYRRCMRSDLRIPRSPTRTKVLFLHFYSDTARNWRISARVSRDARAAFVLYSATRYTPSSEVQFIHSIKRSTRLHSSKRWCFQKYSLESWKNVYSSQRQDR